MVVLCFSVGFKEGSLEMSDWLEQPEEGGMDSNDQTKGKEAEEEEQGELLASIEAESSCLETELKGLTARFLSPVLSGTLLVLASASPPLTGHLPTLNRSALTAC